MGEPLNGLNGLDGSVRGGLISLGIIALASTLSTVTLICFIGYRASRWYNFYAKDIKKNVFVVLLWNLFLADFFQAFGFLFSWHWYGVQDIVSNTGPCTVQGFFINFGDVASAFFVLAIAVQTWAHIRFERQLRYNAFLAIVVCIWIFAMVLTVLGPATMTHYFVDTGAWCWVDAKYKRERLAYHYFWIFLVEFGTVVVYGFVIWELHQSSRKLHTQDDMSFEQAADTHRRIRKSCLIMCSYPISYITLTLPLAISRMDEMRGGETSIPFRIFCGCFLASSGWVDTLLYILTRASFLKSQGNRTDDEQGEQRRSETNSPMPRPDNHQWTLRCSPAPSESSIEEALRLASLSSWSDTKTLSHGRAEEPLSTFDHELLTRAPRTLTLEAKMHGAP